MPSLFHISTSFLILATSTLVVASQSQGKERSLATRSNYFKRTSSFNLCATEAEETLSQNFYSAYGYGAFYISIDGLWGVNSGYTNLHECDTNMRPVGKVVARVAYNCGNENMIRKIDGTFQPLMEIVQCTESYVFLEKDAKGGVNSITNSYVLMGNGDMGKFNECFGTSYDKLIRCQSVCIDLSYACQGKCFSECGAGQCETDLFNCLNLCAPDDYTCQNACYDKYNECTAPFYPCLDQCYPDCYTDYNTCYLSCCGSTLARVQECFEEYYSRENTGILATTGKDLTAAKLRSVVHTEKPIAGYLGDGDSLTNHTEEIARQLGLGTQVEDCARLPKLDEKDKPPKDLMQSFGFIEAAFGFAQVFPEHEFLIVEALRQGGYKVGMTGDGVNDAPALLRRGRRGGCSGGYRCSTGRHLSQQETRPSPLWASY